MQAVKAYAKERGVPPSTVFAAIKAGRIISFPEGGIDPEQADHDWYETYKARAKRIAAGAPARQRILEARALALQTAIIRLGRQIAELECETVPRRRAEVAVARQIARLHSALAALPGLLAPAAAAELQRDPQAVRAMLARFTARLEQDIEPLLSRTDGFSID